MHFDETPAAGDAEPRGLKQLEACYVEKANVEDDRRKVER